MQKRLKFILQRLDQNEERTTGEILAQTGKTARSIKKVCDTIELPWRNNAIGKSCIPAGTYKLIMHHSNRYGPCLWLQGTQPRTPILIHPANYVHQLRGCIAPGKADKLKGEDVVWSSRKAVKEIVTLAEKSLNTPLIIVKDPVAVPEKETDAAE